MARTLFAIVIQLGWVFTQMPILKAMGFGEAAGFPIVIALIRVLLLWLAGTGINGAAVAPLSVLFII